MHEVALVRTTAGGQTGSAEVDGANLWYEVTGSLGAAPPIVLLHAGIGDARMWDDQSPPSRNASR